MTSIRIPPHCVLCKVEPEHAEGYRFPLTENGQVMTRVAWQAVNHKGHPSIVWEAAAGRVPSLLEFPMVRTFNPTHAWCPACLVEYHIGRVHPSEEQAQEKKPLVIVP